MDRLSVLRLLAALLLVFSFKSALAFAPYERYEWQCLHRCPPGMVEHGHATPLAACQAVADRLQVLEPNQTWSVFQVNPNGANDAECKVASNGAYSWPDRPLVRVSLGVGCPANASLVNGQCACASGYVVTGQAGAQTCEQQTTSCPPQGQVHNANTSTRYTMPPGGTVACMGGCLVVPEWQYGTGSNRWGVGPWYSMGASCAAGGGSSAVQEQPAPQQCPRGQCRGTVNGTSVCVLCDSTHSRVDPAPPGASGPAGTTTTTASPDGTVTTSTRDGQGNVTSSSPVGDQIGLEAYCTRNPTAFICTGRPEGSSPAASAPQPSASAPQSSFSGGCGSFSCNGDAVMCAMAREQHQRNCQLFDQATDLSQAGVAATTGGDRPAGHPYSAAESSPLDLASRINQSPLVGTTGGCPSNVSVSSPMGELVIPFGQLCEYLPTLRYVVVAFAMLAAGFIVFGVRSGG